jgi:hypothetical protein
MEALMLSLGSRLAVRPLQLFFRAKEQTSPARALTSREILDPRP